MADPQDRLDFSWSPAPDPDEPPGTRGTTNGRRWLSIYFDCCHTYARIYRAVGGRCYTGWCPRCGARRDVPIGPGGTSQRAFRAG